MNKKEIAEIKKQFTNDRCCITRICGCYVDGEKQKITELKEAFLSLSEEEIFKYYDIFKKSLSGTIGKNLMTMEFPLSEEEDGGRQEFLMRLKKSQLKDDALLEEFYDQVIATYDYPENYYIILIHGAYDIPGKSSDNLEMFDASDEVYEHILCCICPVNLSKAGLSYNVENNMIQDRIRDWIVEMPEVGFLFPLFQDRSTDLHGVLYYAAKAEKIHGDFMEQLLGCRSPLTAANQKDSFQVLVEETLGEDCSYDTAINIHERLSEIIEAQKDEPDPVVLTKSEVKRLFEDCGAKEDAMERFDENYDQVVGERTALTAANITNTRKMEIKTPDITVQVAPDQAELIETREFEGRKYLIIPMEGDVEVNGIRVNYARDSEEE